MDLVVPGFWSHLGLPRWNDYNFASQQDARPPAGANQDLVRPPFEALTGSSTTCDPRADDRASLRQAVGRAGAPERHAVAVAPVQNTTLESKEHGSAH